MASVPNLYAISDGCAMSASNKPVRWCIRWAKKAAAAREGATALSALSRAGHWALEIAEKIGVGVAVAALKTAIGI